MPRVPPRDLPPPDMARRTLRSVAQDAAAVLIAAGHVAADARRDAAILGRHVLRWDAARWLANQSDDAPAGFEAALAPLIRRRAGREPVAYLTGEREFYGRRFRVTPDVLIPRPETEDVVAAALEILLAEPSPVRRDASRVLDVGTGSGCLAVTLALEAPDVLVEATDVSPAALAVARGNAVDLRARVVFHARALTGAAREAFDVIVSNPPYVPERERPTLARDVVAYEPALALFGGVDGLDVIRALVAEAAAALRPGGTLILEIGHGQSTSVRDLLADAGLAWQASRADLAGIPRVVVARRLG